MRRESWRMTPTPGSSVLIPKDLSVLRRHEVRRVDFMGSSSSDEIVHRRVAAVTRVINQVEMNADRALTMEVEAREDSLVRVHVHPRHEPSRLIRANGQQTDSWGAVPLVDVAKVRAVRAVTGEINSPFWGIDQKCSHSVLFVSEIPLLDVWMASRKCTCASLTVTDSSQSSSSNDERPAFFRSGPTPRPTRMAGGAVRCRSQRA